MEEKYYLYKGKLFSEGTLKEKYGDAVQDKINEYGFEEAYSYGDKVFSSGQLKEKYGDNYADVISEKGITPYGVKKKEQTQPQEEVYTSGSQTPVQPSTESGEGIEQEVKQEEYKEPDFFTGKFGTFLKAFDAANPYKIPVGEFIDDMGRAISGGQKQGSTVGDALYVMTKGKNVSDEDIQAYIDIVNESQNQPVSEAMFKFQKELQEKANQNEDKQPTFWDVFSSLNAGVVPEIIVSSLSAMVNPESAAAAGTIVGGSAAGGALFGGAGAVPAALASTPYALAAAGTTLETAVTFSELLQNELAKEQKEFNKENVKELLQNEDKLNSIRAKAVGRGFTIGAIDAMTGKLGGSVGAKVAKKAFKGAKPLGVATTSVIESVGGSGGEAAGRLVAGQEMDKSEIVLEGIGEIGQAPLQFGSAMLNTDIDEVKKSREAAKKKANLKGEGFYEVNGEVVTREQLTDMLKNMTEDDLTSELKIDIENDPEMTQMVNDLFSFAETKQKVKSANPNLSEDNLVEVARREQEISMLKDNDTETAKERVSQLKEEIKSIQEQPQEGKDIAEQKETEQKKQDNAIQEQTTDEVPVQPKAEDSEKVEEGKPQTEFEVATQEVEEVTEKIAPKVQTSPKNLRGLVDTMKSIFSLDKPKAEAAAVVGDKLVDTMSKRAGISKDEMYQRISFTKAQAKDLPQGAKLQVDAWHGSPYQFDKFLTEAIGTGEGAQAFGWGLYFTDLESIARNYADNLSRKDDVLIKAVDESTLTEEAKTLVKGHYINSSNKQDAIDLLSVNSDGSAYFDDAISFLKNYKEPKYLYKVSLQKGKTPDQYTLLEWDKPPTSKIFSIFQDIISKNDFGDWGRILDRNSSQNSGEFYRNLGNALYDKKAKELGYAPTKEEFNKSKAASLFLLENGIDGIKYPAESISRGATSDTARGFNYVVFDENAVSIEEVLKFQKDAEKVRGAMMMAMDNQAIIYALTNPNVTTPLHELAHVYEHYLTEQERKDIIKWAGHKEWTTETSEKFARGFEKYLSEGKAPNQSLQKYFDNFKKWLTEIYNGIVGSDIDVKLNADMRKIYDMMLTDTKKGNKQKQEYAKKQQGGQVRQQGSPQKGKSASNKNMPKGNGTVVQDGKKKPKPLTQETEGLTEKEQAKQGVEEIVQAYKNKLKEAVKKANEKISEKVKEQKQKTQALRDNIKSAKEILTGIIEDSIPKGVKLSKSILKAVTNAKTAKQIQSAADRIERAVERAQIKERIDKIRDKQAKVKKKLPNYTNQSQVVKDLLDTDITKIKDLELLDRILAELDNALTRDVAKLNPKKIEELLGEVKKKSEPQKRITTPDKAKTKITDIVSQDDKTDDKKIRELQSLVRLIDRSRAESMAKNDNEFTIEDRKELLEEIAKELDKLEKGREEDTKRINNESKERLKNFDEKQYTKLQREEIKRLKEQAGKSPKYRDAIKLQDIIDELELGYLPLQQMTEYTNDARSYEAVPLAEKINLRTGLNTIKNKLAWLVGLSKAGTIRGGSLDKSLTDALALLELNEVSAYDDFFGLGKTKDLSKVIKPLFTRAIAKASRYTRALMDDYFAIKYPSIFRGKLKEEDEVAIVMMRKQGDWEVTEGMDTDYWGELLKDRIKSRKALGDDTFKKIETMYNKLPKKDGKLDYKTYFANLKGVPKKMNDFLTQVAKQNSPMQEIANQRIGKEYVERNPEFYLTDIVLGDIIQDDNLDVKKIGALVRDGINLESATGITRTAGKTIKPISVDLDRIMQKMASQTSIDYFVNSDVQGLNSFLDRLDRNVKEPNAKALTTVMKDALIQKLIAEYGGVRKDYFKVGISRLLSAARSYFLTPLERVGAEGISELVRSHQAAKMKYLPKMIKDVAIAKANGKNIMNMLLEDTNSEYLEKSYLEGIAADRMSDGFTKRSWASRTAELTKKSADFLQGVSNRTFMPYIWYTNFVDSFKTISGESFDAKKYVTDEAYRNKVEKNVKEASVDADTEVEIISGAQTRAGRRTKAKWLGTPIIGLIQTIEGKLTGNYSRFEKKKYADPYSPAGMINTFLSSFLAKESFNLLFRGWKDVFHGENRSRAAAGKILLFGLVSNASYMIVKDEILNKLFSDDDEEDDMTWKEKMLNSTANSFIALSVGKYGQSAQLALRTVLATMRKDMDSEQKEKFDKLAIDRFGMYPMQLDYGSTRRAYDQAIPFLGEFISSTLDVGDFFINDVNYKGVVLDEKIFNKIEQGENLSEEEMAYLQAFNLLNNVVKALLTLKGTQVPLQRETDTVIRAIKKVEQGKEVTEREYRALEKYSIIPIIEETLERADKKEN